MTTNTAIEITPSADEVLGNRLRKAIKAFAVTTGGGISIAEIGRRSGIGEQNFRDRMSGKTRFSFEEGAAVARVLGISLTELVRIAETGEGFPLRAKRELTVIQGGGRRTERARTPLLRVCD